MDSFVFDTRVPRVVFGVNSLSDIRREIDLLGSQRVLVLSTRGRTDVARKIGESLGERVVGIFPNALMHVPTETVNKARDEVIHLAADSVVTVGGGSAVGLGKAIALDFDLPIIAVPTTYSGSEMTSIWGITQTGIKKTGRNKRVLPRTVIYDPTLTLGMPLNLTVTSIFNSIAHAAEALYAHDGNPIMSLLAEEGIRTMVAALASIRTDSENINARSHAFHGAWLCGMALGATSMGLHHKLCHILGGSFNLSHADVHTVLLPHVLAYNSTKAPAAMAAIGRALDVSEAPKGMYELIIRMGGPISLKGINMPASGLDQAANLAVENTYPNPRRIELVEIRNLLQRAYEGTPP